MKERHFLICPAPTLIGLVIIFAMLAMIYIVPLIEEFFAERDEPLSTPWLILISVSRHARFWAWLIFANIFIWWVIGTILLRRKYKAAKEDYFS